MGTWRAKRARILALLLLLACSRAVPDQRKTAQGGSVPRGIAQEGSVQEESANEASSSIPSKALVLGVPYISWRDAEGMRFDRKGLANPSFAASTGMILRFWGQDLTLLERSEKALPRGSGGWADIEPKTARGLDDLKPFLSRGIPVLVSTALTPVAHPLVWTGPFAREMTIVNVKTRRTSGVLGDMPSIEDFRKLAEISKLGLSLRQGMAFSGRVVIGYDDERKILVLHDPSFGPAWEVGYDDFDKMWLISERSYAAAIPPDAQKILTNRPPGAPYTPRTDDQRAAAALAFGYAYASIGRGDEAARQFRAGLALPGIGKGYRHLLLVELARRLFADGKGEEAIVEAQKAIELLPENFRPFHVLAEAYRERSDLDSEVKAAQAKGTARALCSDSSAERAIARAFPRDMTVFGCTAPLPPSKD